MFIILSGSSGVGKNTIIAELQKNNNFAYMPTFTTREMRAGESVGAPYYYISKEEFQQKIKDNEFLEYELIHGNYYGSSGKIFDECLAKGQKVIKDVGVQGAQNLTIKVGDKTPIVKIFLTVKHKSELKKRLIGRGEKDIALRLKRFNYEQKQKNFFDYIIYNESLDKTTNLLHEIFKLKNSDFIPCKKMEFISKYKVKFYTSRLKCGKTLSPIKIVILSGKAYIVSGVEKFVASIISGKSVAKLVIDKKIEHTNNVLQNWYDNVL